MPRKSVLCKQCRRRKEPSDGERQLCQRCIDSGFECNVFTHRRSLSTHTDNGRQRQASLDLVRSSYAAQTFKRAASVDPRTLQQMQMLSDFLENHFPTAEAKASLTERRSYLRALPDIDLSSPLLRVAVNTLCLAHLGSKHGDARLIQESQAAYGQVLHKLAKAIGQTPAPGQQHQDNAIVASIMLLCIYNDPLPFSHQTSTGWAAHYWGAQRYIEARGTSCLNIAEPFDRLLLMNLRMPSLFIGMAERKATVLGKPEWIAYMDNKTTTATSLAALYRYVMSIPSLLERSDNLLAKETEVDNLRGLCKDLCILRDSLFYWNTYECYSNAANDSLPSVEITDLGAFDMNIEEHCFMTSSPTFTSFHAFQSYRHAEDRSLYWVLSLIADCMVFRILHFHPSASSYLKSETPEGTLRNAYATASNLCRTLYYFSNYQSLAVASWADLQVWLAYNFFEDIGAYKELGWCQAARCAIKLRVDRLEPTQTRSLCRLADVAAGVAMATHFKAPNAVVESCPMENVRLSTSNGKCPVSGVS